MTKEQKERKLKLILLIIMVNTEYARRKPFTNVWETIAFALDNVWWAMEYKRVKSQPTFEKGGIAIVGNSKEPEVILRRHNF